MGEQDIRRAGWYSRMLTCLSVASEASQGWAWGPNKGCTGAPASARANLHLFAYNWTST